MKYYILFILFFATIYSCNNNEVITQTDANLSEEEISDKLDAIVSNEPIIPLLPLSENYELARFLIGIKKDLIEQNLDALYEKIDPLQKAIQEDMKMDLCQNTKELMSLHSKEFGSDCELLNQIAIWEYKGYQVIEEGSFQIMGKATFSNGTEQEFSFKVNQLTEEQYVITGIIFKQFIIKL